MIVADNTMHSSLTEVFGKLEMNARTQGAWSDLKQEHHPPFPDCWLVAHSKDSSDVRSPGHLLTVTCSLCKNTKRQPDTFCLPGGGPRAREQREVDSGSNSHIVETS